MFGKRNKSVTVKGTVRLLQPLPESIKKTWFGRRPEWSFELTPSSSEQTNRSIRVALDTELGIALVKGLLHEGHEVEVKVAYHDKCSCGNAVLEVVNHSMGGMRYQANEIYTSASSKSEKIGDTGSELAVINDLRYLRGRLYPVDNSSQDSDNRTENNRRKLANYVVKSIDSTGQITDQLTFAACGRWWQNTLVGDFLRNGDELEITGKQVRGIFRPNRIINRTLEEQAIDITPNRQTNTKQYSWIWWIIGTIISLLINMLIAGRDSLPFFLVLYPLYYLGIWLVHRYLHRVFKHMWNDKKWGVEKSVWFYWLSILISMLVTGGGLTVGALSVIAIQHPFYGISIFNGAIRIFSLLLTPILSCVVYFSLFPTKHSSHSIKLKGIARVIDRHPVPAFQIDFLGRLFSFQNIEVLSFRLETNISQGLGRMLPSGFMLPSSMDEHAFISTEMRGHIEGHLVDGDNVEFEAWSDGYSFFTKLIRNFSTLSVVRANEPVRWIYFLFISGAVLLALQFLCTELVQIAQSLGFPNAFN